ncbi:MAG: N-6 DNA methylase [Bacillota bacterium]|nr:N-6 DNA methylase [Bacillota bacterium]
MSETETVIKKILPYIQRRGYDIEQDLRFEDPTELDTENRQGFIDILVSCGKKQPLFIIEAKRDGTKLTAKHRKQAIDYGKSTKCLFVALTNGQVFELLNVKTGSPLKLNGSAFNRLPSKTELIKIVIPELKKNPSNESIFISTDKSIPFKPGVPLTKLNRLIQQCHNIIRKIEKNEENAFSDFSKILFLKLLEEKWDMEGQNPPYTYLFHELAATSKENADQVQVAIRSMIDRIATMPNYGEVLAEPIHLRQDQTYLAIVKLVSSVSWNDCNLDSKGAAFEYFVRASLKGKKLGQYFTPRPLVQLMLRLGRYEQILQNLKASQPFKVIDPACGTGGFLVHALNQAMEDLQKEVKDNTIHQTLYNTVKRQLKEETFYGIDAHDGVASTAKMNMIIAGDGHNNIRALDTLKLEKLIPNYTYYDTAEQKEVEETDGKAHLILSNPPFGTSEGESLSSKDLEKYPVKSTKGQSLFIQQMIMNLVDNSRIVTVIDEGVLNTASYTELREFILQNCRIEYIISMPDETFKPNKINVKTSVLVLKKRDPETIDEFLEDEYPISVLKVESLGYDGAGIDIRSFKLEQLIKEIEEINPGQHPYDKELIGYYWRGNIINSKDINEDETKRFDYKYWNSEVKTEFDRIEKSKSSITLKKLNLIETKRGSSPNSSDYVSKDEGYSLVIKAGSNISKNGILLTDGDYVEKNIYNEYEEKGKLVVQDGDILLASTGDGTLGKCCVYRNYDKEGKSLPAIPDGHVTVIRVDSKKFHPEYVCDYLRRGFGALQVQRLYTGSTGLIEIQPGDVEKIVFPKFPTLKKQIEISDKLRVKEFETEKLIKQAQEALQKSLTDFYKATL